MASFDEQFGKKVRALRERALTQSQLAAEMTAAGHRMYQTTIAKIESGERPVSFDEAVSLAEVLGADLAEMAGMHTAGEDSAQRALVDARIAVRAAERDQAMYEQELAVAQVQLDVAQHRWAGANALLDKARANLERLEKKQAQRGE